MKKILGVVAIFLVIGVAAAYIYMRGSDKHLQLIPKNSFMVASVDVKTLGLKANYDKLKELNWMKDMQKKSSEQSQDSLALRIMDIVRHPLSTGVNLLSDVYFFAAKSGDAGDIGGGMVIDIKDEKAFEETVKKLSPTVVVTTRKGYKMVYMSGVALAWNATGAILGGTVSMTDSTKTLAFMDAAFNRSRSESILSNEMFIKFDKSKKDVSFFMNGGEMVDIAKSLPGGNRTAATALSYAGDSYKGMYTWFYLNFGDDKIALTSHLEAPNNKDTKFDMLNSSGLSSDHMSLITTKSVYAILSANLNMKKMFDYYESIPAVKTYEVQIAQTMGMSVNDFQNVLGGEISLALVDVKKSDAPAPAAAAEEDVVDEYGMPVAKKRKYPPLNPSVVFNFSSKNKPGLTKLLTQYTGGKNDKGFYTMPLPGGISVNAVENKIGFTITNDADIAGMIATKGTLGPLPSNVSDLVKNNPSMLYWDLNVDDYPDAVKTLVADAAANDKSIAATVTYMKLFRDLTITGNPRDSEMDLNFTKGEGNTLYRLLAQGDLVYNVMKPSAIQ